MIFLVCNSEDFFVKSLLISDQRREGILQGCQSHGPSGRHLCWMLVFIFHSANSEYILNPISFLFFTVLQTRTDDGWVSSGRWMAKLVARLLAKAAGYESRYISKIQN